MSTRINKGSLTTPRMSIVLAKVVIITGGHGWLLISIANKQCIYYAKQDGGLHFNIFQTIYIVITVQL